MTVPTSTITLTYDPGGPGEASVTLASPPPGYQMGHERAQALGRTADGTPYVYDRETTIYSLTLPVVLTKTQRDNLDTFVTSTVKGALNTFRLVDHLGNTLNSCRFTEPSLMYVKTKSAQYRVTLRIQTPSTAE